jgi:hypothetical protein
MRQLGLVFLDPNQIPRIDPAAARLAPEKMFGLTDAPPVGARRVPTRVASVYRVARLCRQGLYL